MSRPLTAATPSERTRPGSAPPGGQQLLVGLQRAAGNRAVAGLLARPPASPARASVQRSVGFEFELSSPNSWNAKKGASLAQAMHNAADRRRLDKGAVLLRGPNFELQADDQSNSPLSDIEFVTDPFAEDDKVGLRSAIGHIVAICELLDVGGGMIPTTTLSGHGRVKKKRSFIQASPNMQIKPQASLGIPLDKLFQLMREIGHAQPGETAADTAGRQQGREQLFSYPPVGSVTAPTPGARRVGDATSVVETAIQNYRSAVHAAHWHPGDETKGLLALLWVYLDTGSLPLAEYAKTIAPLMARTDFATMFTGLPWADQTRLGARDGDELVRLLSFCKGMGAMDYDRPVFAGIYAGTGSTSTVLDSLTRRAWLRGITQGVDKLTEQHFPDPRKEVRAELQGLGGLGNRTDAVTGGAFAPIFELRGMRGGLDYDNLHTFAQLVRKYAKHTSTGANRTFAH